MEVGICHRLVLAALFVLWPQCKRCTEFPRLVFISILGFSYLSIMSGLDFISFDFLLFTNDAHQNLFRLWNPPISY